MNRHHVQGTVDTVSGKVKETAGTVLRNRSLKTEGKVQQLRGAVHTGYGNVQDAASNLRSNVRKILS